MLIKGQKVIMGSDVQAPAMEVIAQGNIVAATDTTVGGMFKIQNDFGQDLIVTDVLLDLTTGATGVASMDMGTHATGLASSNNLFDALAMQALTGVKDNRKNGGAAGGMAVWKKDEYIVATATATMAGLVGEYKIKAVPR